MIKLTGILLIAASVISSNSFATDTKPAVKIKKTTKCTMGSGTCCKKSISRSAMLKGKIAIKKA